MIDSSARIVVAGAGSVGGYVGGALAAGGRKVALLARARIADAIHTHGLRVTDNEGRERLVELPTIEVTTEPAGAMADADVVLVTVKSGATAEMAELIAAHAPRDAPVVSLQNGIGNADMLRRALPEHTVLAGMVPFNVVQRSDAGAAFHVHRASGGTMLVEPGVGGLAVLLDVEGLTTATHADMQAVLWGKLLLNLNNALVALSGLTLVEELSDRSWRRILAAMMQEGLATMKAAGIQPVAAAGPPPALIPHLLRLPDGLFRLLARRMLAIDAKARSSMWEDLAQGRITEIDELQGAIVRLAETAGTETPLNKRVMDLIRKAENERAGSPGLTPSEVSSA